MIRAFPDLHQGELMYSGYARHARRVGYPNLKNVIDELFGSRQIIASIPFSSHLDYFITHQPCAERFTAESLIAEHTLLPFYAPFLPLERTQQLQMDMREANGPGIYMRVGLMASMVPSNQYLQYCPECAKEDQIRFGETYWHRHHQIPGVLVCHIHNVWLDQSNVQVHNRKTRHQFVASEEALQPLLSPRAIDTSTSLCDTLLFIANSAGWLLQQRDLSPGLEFLHDAYKRALISRNLATYSGRIRMTKLQEAFASYYSEDVLSYLHSSLNRQSSDNWLARLVRKPDSSQHSLQHLLLMHFLGSPIESFFSSPSDSHPFGTGPWPCLNAASDHYHQRQIEHCEMLHSKYVRGRPVGIFSCSCGFVYSRTGPDASPEDQFHFSKINAFGPIWETKLQALWKDESVSLRGLARQLGVDPLTIKRHATRLGLLFPRLRDRRSGLEENQQLHPHVFQAPETTVLQEYRTTWLTALESGPGIGVTELRSKMPGIYTWLYRNDRVWLRAHTPILKEKPTIRHQRVDWKERDKRLAEEVIVAASRLKDLPGRPVHITLTTIGREIGQLALFQQHLDKLPRTAKALEGLVESREVYAVRRIQWTARDCIQSNIYLVRWLLIKKAGVARLAEQSQVKDAIDDALQLFSDSTLEIEQDKLQQASLYEYTDYNIVSDNDEGDTV
jgi:Tn7-like transposition protein D/TniQ